MIVSCWLSKNTGVLVMNSEWLNNLNVGDQVIIAGRNGDSISIVERLTKTLIITKKNRKFRKDGSSPGGGWDRELLVEASPERVEKIQRARMAHVLSRYDWKTLPLAKLYEIWNSIPKGEKS